MKGILLGGGTGSRLYPVTYVLNKHFLPIYNKPMIYYSFSILALAKIRDILIVCSPEDLRNYKKLFGDGSHLGMRVDYAIQENPRGLADGLLKGEEFAEGDSVCLILGDNIFYGHELQTILNEAKKNIESEGGAIVFGYHVKDPERYGVVEFDEEGNVISIEEKPKNPKSSYAITGLYFYDNTCFEKAKRIKPSDRGELEITSVNQEYLKEGRLKVKLLGRGFAWFDAGTHDSFIEASEFVATIEKRTGHMIGCIEEIVYRNGWISREQLIELAKPLIKTDYGKYLMMIAEEDKCHLSLKS